MPPQPKRVFAVAAHPDDIEFFMAGTLILLGRAGYEMHYMNIANGCCGSTADRAGRDGGDPAGSEAMAAGRVDRGRFPSAAWSTIWRFFTSCRRLRRLAAVMRQVAPEILLTHPPADYMEDHRTPAGWRSPRPLRARCPTFATDPPRADRRSAGDDLSCPAARQSRSAGRAGAAEPVCRHHRRDRPEDRDARAVIAARRSWLDTTQGRSSLRRSRCRR